MEWILGILFIAIIYIVVSDRSPCGSCKCGGKIYRTPSKNLKGGGIQMGGYKCDSCSDYEWANKEDWYVDRSRG